MFIDWRFNFKIEVLLNITYIISENLIKVPTGF